MQLLLILVVADEDRDETAVTWAKFQRVLDQVYEDLGEADFVSAQVLGEVVLEDILRHHHDEF